jgi:hypothetical protein
MSKPKVPRPRYRFCWWCSRQLWGNVYRMVIVDGIDRIVHAACARLAKASDGK